jgi:capsular exopolysaccharide synthesis family protein
MNHRPAPVAEGLPEIDLLGLYYTLRRQAWVIGGCTAAALGLCLGYLWWAPKVYVGESIVQVEQSDRSVMKITGDERENLQSAEFLKTLEQNLGSTPVLERVVRSPKLHLTAAAVGLKKKPGEEASDGELIYQLSQRISVSLVRGTRLIGIHGEALDPEVAGALPNVVLEEYQAGMRQARAKQNRDANVFLMGEVKRLSEKLQTSKKAMQEYRERTNAVSLEESRNITDARLRELNGKVTEAKSLRLKLEAEYAQVKGVKDPKQLLNVSSVATAPAVLEGQKALAAQEAELANLSTRYREKHPKYIQAQSQLGEVRAALDRAIHTAADGLANSVEAARAAETKFEEALREQEGMSLNLGRLAIDYEAMVRAVEADTALYQSVLTRLNETDVAKNLQPEILRVVTPSSPPVLPSKPRKKLALAIALLGGGLLGLGIALGRIALDRSLHTVDQAEQVLNMPALGSVPRGVGATQESELPLVREPHGAAAENFRTLRTSLALLSPAAPRRFVLFTSGIPGEGKSFCAANYAVAQAMQGLCTLLIDADMRLPSLEKLFFQTKAAPGLAEVLLGQMPLTRAARPAQQPKLSVLTAGGRPQHPAEVLAGAKFSDLLREAGTAYDCIVIDTAPVHAVSDTLLLVRAVDTVVLVVQAGRTPRKAVLRAERKLIEAGAPLAGFVLNRMPLESGRDYYHHYGAGAYGEGVYGAPGKG